MHEITRQFKLKLESSWLALRQMAWELSSHFFSFLRFIIPHFYTNQVWSHGVLDTQRSCHDPPAHIYLPLPPAHTGDVSMSVVQDRRTLRASLPDSFPYKKLAKSNNHYDGMSTTFPGLQLLIDPFIKHLFFLTDEWCFWESRRHHILPTVPQVTNKRSAGLLISS